MQKPIRRTDEPFKLPNDMLDELQREVDAAPQPRLPLLDERQQTHGSFEENAIISQALKRMFRANSGWARLTDVEHEALDMIALKFSRILSGKSMSRQHWEDCAGYAQLVLERCL